MPNPATDIRKCANCSKSTDDDPSLTLRACSRCKETAYCSKTCQSENWAAHKTICSRMNYVLKFHLCPGEISDPPVTRSLSVPAKTTFAKLHHALQIAFGWAGTHAYDFAWRDPEFEEDDGMDVLAFVHNMMMNKTAASPREFVMRVSEKPTGDMMFFQVDRMHEEWYRKHPRTVEKPAERTTLFQVLDDKEHADKEMQYMYDFGDGWQHIIFLEGRTKASNGIKCIDGTGHGFAEDVKRPGWQELKEAYRTSRPNREQRDKREWFEQQASNCDPRGLGNGREHEWSKDDVNRRLAAAGL